MPLLMICVWTQGGTRGAILYGFWHGCQRVPTLPQVREIVEGLKDGGLALMINPQWQSGNLVNDFGIGPWRRRSEDFVALFQEVYILKQMRIAGDNVRCVQQHKYHSAFAMEVNIEEIEIFKYLL